MCDEPATTKEHVPPKCFFPEQKDTPKGLDYRRNLITVPSCDEHNCKKSGDDEYLRTILTLAWRSSSTAGPNIEKIQRALIASKSKFDQFLGMETHQRFSINGKERAIGIVDIPRFIAGMKKIARGIYFVHFGQKPKWREKIYIYPQGMGFAIIRNSLDHSLLEWYETCRSKCLPEPKHWPNPDIFYYQLVQNPYPIYVRPSGLAVTTSKLFTIMRLVFYGGFEVIVHDFNQIED
jgi:hypothetical protein